jgi:hypothetical protein|tara:strand:- start:533 stop:1090 length:558 start_codon:yes stop_codon:yes gene_type:complete
MNKNTENPTTDNQGVKSDSVQTDENVSVDTTDNVKDPVESIPYARFNEVNKQKRELETKLKEYQDKQEAQRVKAMEEQGKFKELNTELTNKLQSYEEKLNVYAEKEKKERENLISQLDDQDKEVYGSLSNDQLRKHLEKSKKQSVTTNVTPPIRDKSGNKITDWATMSPEDKRSNWKSIIKSYKK